VSATKNTNIEAWLQALGDTIGVPLTLNEQGLCAFNYDGMLDLVIEVTVAATLLFLYTPIISSRHTENNEALYEQLLKLNYPGRQTPAAAFALNRRSGEIVLCLVRPLSQLDQPGFFALIQDFLESARHGWMVLHGPALDDSDATAVEGAVPHELIDTRFRV
jgi:hypothetical protein